MVMLTAAPHAFSQSPAPPKERAERLTYDPDAGQWGRTPDPVPGTEDGDLDIARQWQGREENKRALKLIKKWMKTYGGPTSGRYPEALYVKATAHLELGDYRSAHETYQELLNDYPGSPYAERALSANFRIAEQYLAGKKRKAWGGLLRLRARDTGVEIMDDLIANYPDTPLAELAQRSKADYYFARGEFELAEDEYAHFAREYPRSRYHSYALLQSAKAALASFPGVKFDDAGLVEAQARFSQFLKAYPELARQLDVAIILEQVAARRADKTHEIAWFYDRTGQKQAASYYYRATIANWPNTPAAAQSQGRLAALGEPVPSTNSADGQSEPPSEQGSQ